ncbi:Flp family type IVb pilin [Acetobacter orientalis]|uniref:Flp family type IVb pilin n=1 Tax=Acetobacter orientalis TaxID=146474 RepID=UPI003869E306
MILRKVKYEVGATAIEYGLIASLIGVLAVSGMSAVGMNLSNTYCTVSKYLGGSGECPGSTNSNSSGSSSTGSGGSGSSTENGENGSGTPITTEDDMNKLKDSLSENFDDDYLDSSLGGKNNYEQYKSPVDAKETLSIMNDYNKNNPNDPITHVFGLYDSFTHQPITSWQKASEGLKSYSNGANVIESGAQNDSSIEVTTQSGHVYSVSGLWNTMTEHLIKGS